MAGPVWEVYDALRTVRLNVRCYEFKLSSAKRTAFWLDIVSAGSASSAVAGIWLWQTPLGIVLWKALGSASAIVSVYQLVARPSDRVRELEARVTNYRALDFDLDGIRRRIQEQRAYSPELRAQFHAVMERLRGLSSSYSDPVDDDTRDLFQAAVQKELPVSAFYDPQMLEE